MNRNTKSFSFLVEFIIVLFLFTISSTICINMQIQSSQLNRKANDTKIAIHIIQNFISQPNSSFYYNCEGKPSRDGYFKIIKEVKEEMTYVSVQANDEILITLPFSEE